MDRGRVIDNIQNVNARFIDQYGAAGKTSVKTTNPPGWDVPEEKPVKKTVQTNNINYNEPKNNISYNQNQNPSEEAPKDKTSVRVKHAPGGKSNFSLGYDNINYDDYKKNI